MTDDRNRSGRAPRTAFFFVWTLRQAPRLDARSPQDRAALALAPLQARQGEAERGDRPHAQGAAGPTGLSHRDRRWFRYRRRGDGAVVAAGPEARRRARVGKLRRGLG